MIHFVVDSTFCLTDEYIKQNDIKVVSLKTVLEGKTYVEANRSEWEEFYTKLSSSKDFPKSSCPTPEDFKIVIEDILKEDKNAEIFVLTFSDNLSGTYNSARVAIMDFPENTKIKLIDLKTYTTSSKLILEDAVCEKNNGKSFEELEKVINKDIENSWVRFIPYSMESLKKGGRVSLLKAIVADLLHIKPVLEFSRGIFKTYKKALGISKAMFDMLSSVPKKFKKLNLMCIFDEKIESKLKESAKRVLGRDDFEVVNLGPVAGTHIGIGSVGVAVLEDL